MQTQNLPSRRQITRVREAIFRRWTPTERSRRAEQASALQSMLFEAILGNTRVSKRQPAPAYLP
jgi:hypothetical protein